MSGHLKKNSNGEIPKDPGDLTYMLIIHCTIYVSFLAHCVLRRFEKQITIHMVQILQRVLKKSTQFCTWTLQTSRQKTDATLFCFNGQVTKESVLRTKLDVRKNPKTFFVG